MNNRLRTYANARFQIFSQSNQPSGHTMLRRRLDATLHTRHLPGGKSQNPSPFGKLRNVFEP